MQPSEYLTNDWWRQRQGVRTDLEPNITERIPESADTQGEARERTRAELTAALDDARGYVAHLEAQLAEASDDRTA